MNRNQNRLSARFREGWLTPEKSRILADLTEANVEFKWLGRADDALRVYVPQEFDIGIVKDAVRALFEGQRLLDYLESYPDGTNKYAVTRTQQ